MKDEIFINFEEEIVLRSFTNSADDYGNAAEESSFIAEALYANLLGWA